MSHMTLDPAAMGSSDLYSLLVNVVQPRPIAFVSTVSADGTPNLAPFSFFMVGGINPPSLMFSPVLGKDGRVKDSLRNVLAEHEFTVNTVHRTMADGMNAASALRPMDESEWPFSGFTSMASDVVRPPRVAESLVSFECRLHQVVEHGDGEGAARYVIGEIVRIHISETILSLGQLDPDRFQPIARLGGPHYLDLADGTRFSLQRP